MGHKILISRYDIQTYCAYFDKSTNFGIEVDQYIMSKCGGGAIAELPPGCRGGHFPKWPPAGCSGRHISRKMRCNWNFVLEIKLFLKLWSCSNISAWYLHNQSQIHLLLLLFNKLWLWKKSLIFNTKLNYLSIMLVVEKYSHFVWTIVHTQWRRHWGTQGYICTPVTPIDIVLTVISSWSRFWKTATGRTLIAQSDVFVCHTVHIVCLHVPSVTGSIKNTPVPPTTMTSLSNNSSRFKQHADEEHRWLEHT